MNDATAASVKALSMKILRDSNMLQAESDDNLEVSKHLETAAKYLKIVAEMEQAGIEHSDAAMITMLIGLREKLW